MARLDLPYYTTDDAAMASGGAAQTSVRRGEVYYAALYDIVLDANQATAFCRYVRSSLGTGRMREYVRMHALLVHGYARA